MIIFDSTEPNHQKWGKTFFSEPKRATIDFQHCVGFNIYILKIFTKIRGNKLSLSHNLKINQGKPMKIFPIKLVWDFNEKLHFNFDLNIYLKRSYYVLNFPTNWGQLSSSHTEKNLNIKKTCHGLHTSNKLFFTNKLFIFLFVIHLSI